MGLYLSLLVSFVGFIFIFLIFFKVTSAVCLKNVAVCVYI